jgi:hypothetical protein
MADPRPKSDDTEKPPDAKDEGLVCGYPSDYWENDLPDLDPPAMQRYSKEGTAKFEKLVADLQKRAKT